MAIERRAITNREEWLRWRRQDVTASTIGALFGVHPYTTALRMFCEKRGTEFPEQDDNRILRRGRWLEPAVAEAVRELRPEWKIEAPKVYVRDDELRLGCTPDFLINGDPRGLGILQTKTVAPSVFERDWAKGSDVPLWVTLQCLCEMMLCDASFGAVAAMLVDPHNMDVAILDVPRHPPSEEKIRAAVRNFWAQIAHGVEPEPNFDRDAEAIRALTLRESKGKQLDLSGNNSVPQLLTDRAAYMSVIADAEQKKAAIENEIKFMMGDAETAIGIDGWKISYRTQHRSAYSVPEKDLRILNIRDQRAQS